MSQSKVVSDKSSYEFRHGFLTATLVIGIALAFVFLLFPQIDIIAAHQIRVVCAGPSGVESWCDKSLLQPPRQAFIGFTVLVGVAALVAFVRGRICDHLVFGVGPIGRVGWLFITAHFVLGVGGVANVILKDHWGRARPHQIVAYGGTKEFTPPLVVSDQCEKNCSFVSGEATAVYAPFFAAAVLVPQYGVPLAATGVVAGVTSGFVRMLSGSHFLSDVLFAGVFAALTAIALHIVFFARAAEFRNRFGWSAATGYPLEVTDWWPPSENWFRLLGYQYSNYTADPV